MESFVGRKKELRLLEEAWKAPGSVLLPIYGRRRVGKSELILRFLRGKKGVYFVGKRAPPGSQIREFLGEAADALDEPLLAEVQADSWAAALRLVVGRWKGPGKLALAFDEFQWMAAASPELPSVLQELWDGRWKVSGSIVLILCGSYIGFMEREVLGRKSPLFGRRSGQILLRPFSYREAAEFHPRWAPADRARAWFLCGGIPWYLRFFSDRASIEHNIRDVLLSEHAALFREPEFLLREELREVENYHSILMAVAAGSLPAREISRQAGIGERSLHYYLHHLVELGYLARRHPLAGGKSATRNVRYAVEDPLLRFWFRFVFPRASGILRLGPERAYESLVAPEIESYFGTCFERLCREALPFLYEREGVTASAEVGEYWDKSVQIDVVGLRSDRWADLGECRWGPVPSASRLCEELEERVRAWPNKSGVSIGRRIFTRAAVRGKRPPEIRWHDLVDLYR